MSMPPGLDAERLAGYLRAHRPDLAKGDLRGTLITGGRSNLTYVVNDGTSEYVLRRPPLGHVLATAHDMAREFTVLSALAGTAVPVPTPYLLCTDPEVLGAPFYLMSRVPGVVLRNRHQTDPMSEAQRHDIAHAMIDTLAALHDVDHRAVGLGGFGRPEGFLARQVRRWSAQLEQSRSRDLPGADRLRDRLAATVPCGGPPTLVHGDYRLDNLLVDPTSRRVAAVLDWEMATVGDPLTDVALLLVQWDVVSTLDTAWDPIGPHVGFPTGRQLLDRYTRLRPVDPSALPWYTGLACYKLAVVVEGIHFRFGMGRTVGAGFDRMGELTLPLIAHGLAATA